METIKKVVLDAGRICCYLDTGEVFIFPDIAAMREMCQRQTVKPLDLRIQAIMAAFVGTLSPEVVADDASLLNALLAIENFEVTI